MAEDSLSRCRRVSLLLDLRLEASGHHCCHLISPAVETLPAAETSSPEDHPCRSTISTQRNIMSDRSKAPPAGKHKIVVCRDMGDEAMGLLHKSGHEVRCQTASAMIRAGPGSSHLHGSDSSLGRGHATSPCLGTAKRERRSWDMCYDG